MNVWTSPSLFLTNMLVLAVTGRVKAIHEMSVRQAPISNY